MQVLIFAAIAAFVLFKLYSVLGKDVGAKPGAQPSPLPVPAKKTPPRRPALRPAFTGPAAAGLEQIHAADNRFDPKSFLAGAAQAYELIVTAYAAGNKKALKPLLKASVFERYAQAIDARAAQNKVLDTEIIRLHEGEIVRAKLAGRIATIEVKFSADISTRESKVGEEEGALATTSTTTEVWAFERDVRNKNPNWKLAAVSSLV